ncbi:MAG: hypothetical protein M3Y57_09230 [Acidobacteriota bacterium]|nr:hypothetical protein [Acidobacteriota bacterium]
MLRPLLLLLCFSALLSAQVRTPHAGFVRYDDGTVREAQGIEASFVLSDPIATSVDAASFSDVGGMISAQGVIRLLGPSGLVIGEEQSGETHPLLNIEGDLPSAIAWLPSAQAILRWDGTSFRKTSLTVAVAGQVTSLRAVGHTADLLVRNENAVSAVTISLDSGDQVSDRLVPDVTVAAIQFKGYVVYRGEDGVEFASADGSRRTAPMPAPDLTVERMSSDWLHLESHATARHWALHVTATGLQLSELPGQAPSSTLRGGK